MLIQELLFFLMTQKWWGFVSSFNFPFVIKKRLTNSEFTETRAVCWWIGGRLLRVTEDISLKLHVTSQEGSRTRSVHLSLQVKEETGVSGGEHPAFAGNDVSGAATCKNTAFTEEPPDKKHKLSCFQIIESTFCCDETNGNPLCWLLVVCAGLTLNRLFFQTQSSVPCCERPLELV